MKKEKSKEKKGYGSGQNNAKETRKNEKGSEIGKKGKQKKEKKKKTEPKSWQYSNICFTWYNPQASKPTASIILLFLPLTNKSNRGIQQGCLQMKEVREGDTKNPKSLMDSKIRYKAGAHNTLLSLSHPPN